MLAALLVLAVCQEIAAKPVLQVSEDYVATAVFLDRLVLPAKRAIPAIEDQKDRTVLSVKRGVMDHSDHPDHPVSLDPRVRADLAATQVRPVLLGKLDWQDREVIQV